MAFPPSIWLSRVAVLFAMGSGLLLLGAIAFARGGYLGFGFLLVFAWLGAGLHGLGWYHLNAAAYVDPGGRAIRAAGGTVVGFLGGLVAVAVLAPPAWGFLFAALPYVPFVFAPVVLVHVDLFLSFSDELAAGRDRGRVRAGSYLLLALAAIGVAGQAIHFVAGPDLLRLVLGDDALRHLAAWAFLPYPAGLTALGYALVWWGFGPVAVQERAARVDGPPSGPVPQ